MISLISLIWSDLILIDVEFHKQNHAGYLNLRTSITTPVFCFVCPIRLLFLMQWHASMWCSMVVFERKSSALRSRGKSEVSCSIHAIAGGTSVRKIATAATRSGCCSSTSLSVTRRRMSMRKVVCFFNAPKCTQCCGHIPQRARKLRMILAKETRQK